MILRTSLTAILVQFALVAGALAQNNDPFQASGDNPFGTPQQPGGGIAGFGGLRGPTAPATTGLTSGAGAGVDAILNEPDPVVRMVRETPPRSPEEFAQAVLWLARLKEWAEVGRLIDGLGRTGWGLSEKATVARIVGPKVLALLRSPDVGLNDQQKQLVAELQRAPSLLARDPAQIEAWIDRLADESPAQRMRARIALQDAQDAAVGPLLNRLLAGDSRVPGAALVQMLVDIGPDGIDALRCALLINSPEQVERVALALAARPATELTVELGLILLGGVISPDATREAASRLEAAGRSIPGRDRIVEFFNNEWGNRLAEYQKLRMEPQEVPDRVWRLKPSRDGVVSQMAREVDVALERLANLAALRLKTTGDLAADVTQRAQLVAALLQRAYQVHPNVVDPDLTTHLLVDLPAASGAFTTFWREVFEQSNQQQFHGAALRVVQHVGRASGEEIEVLDFLRELLGDPRPVIRYSAVEALATIDPHIPFAGTERALEVAVEMTRLGSGPSVLVVGLRPDLRQVAIQQLITVAGAEVTDAATKRIALLTLKEERPFELIVVVDRVPDDSLSQLLQRIRGSKRGQAIPIAVLTDDLFPHERTWIAQTPGVIKGLLTRNAENMRTIVDRMWDTLDTRPLTAADRLHFVQVGQQFLTRILSDRQTYHFYPIEQWQREIVDVAVQLDPRSRIMLLTGLPTGVAQMMLVEIAARTAYDESARVEAARAFGQSVRRHGMLLLRDDVLKCYDLYNTIGPKDPVAVRALGYVLDVIEAHAADRPIPAGP